MAIFYLLLFFSFFLVDSEVGKFFRNLFNFFNLLSVRRLWAMVLRRPLLERNFFFPFRRFLFQLCRRMLQILGNWSVALVRWWLWLLFFDNNAQRGCILSLQKFGFPLVVYSHVCYYFI
jgi:hypothetical protein